MSKKNFKIDDVVYFHSTGGSELDGRIGSILGTSFINVQDFYIVLLNTPTPTHKAIVITEACIDLFG